MRTLTAEEARAFYDRFGIEQDWQIFYEADALHALVAYGDFPAARTVLELGCGTGRFAVELLHNELGSTSRYLGVDISNTMVQIARWRLAQFGERASVLLASSEPRLPVADAAVDRFVSTYVLDLLPEASIRQVLAEARRVLRPTGLICLARITAGRGIVSQIVMSIWQRLFDWNAGWVGGCRPISIHKYLIEGQWTIYYRDVISAWGIASEMVVASPLGVGPPA